MVELQGQITPTTEAEMTLIERLYDVTGDAYEDDVPVEEIVVAMNFVACSIVAYEDEDGRPDTPDRSADAKRETCPKCGEEMDDVLASLGGAVEVRPCGCKAEVQDLPGWFSDD